MRSVPRSRLEIIRMAHPNARVEEREGHECVVIPTYDITTDTAGESVLRLTEDRDIARKPQVGDIMQDKFGNTFKIVAPPDQIIVREGPKASWDE